MVDTPAFADEVIQSLRELFQDSHIRERSRGLADTRSFPVWLNCEIYYQVRSQFPGCSVALDHRHPDSDLADILIRTGDRRTGPVFRIEGDGAVCDSDGPGLVVAVTTTDKGADEADARLKRIEERLPECVETPGFELLRENGASGGEQPSHAIRVCAYRIRQPGSNTEQPC